VLLQGRERERERERQRERRERAAHAIIYAWKRLKLTRRGEILSRRDLRR